jgi:hypothetical protein
MPGADTKKVTTTGISRVLLKGDGWVEIEPDSFNVVTLEFYKKKKDQNEDDEFTGLNYRAYVFKDKTTGNLLCVSPDGLAAIEIVEGGTN